MKTILIVICCIFRIIYGLLPFIWGVSLWASNKKGKLETLCATLSAVMFIAGILECIFMGIDGIGGLISYGR